MLNSNIKLFIHLALKILDYLYVKDDMKDTCQRGLERCLERDSY